MDRVLGEKVFSKSAWIQKGCSSCFTLAIIIDLDKRKRHPHITTVAHVVQLIKNQRSPSQVSQEHLAGVGLQASQHPAASSHNSTVGSHHATPWLPKKIRQPRPQRTLHPKPATAAVLAPHPNKNIQYTDMMHSSWLYSCKVHRHDAQHLALFMQTSTYKGMYIAYVYTHVSL